MKALLVQVLKGYKRWISPLLPVSCRYVPTCSEYAIEAIRLHGAVRGSALAMGRLLRCHPFVRGGYDPPPRQASNECAGASRLPVHAGCEPKISKAAHDAAL